MIERSLVAMLTLTMLLTIDGKNEYYGKSLIFTFLVFLHSGLLSLPNVSWCFTSSLLPLDQQRSSILEEPCRLTWVCACRHAQTKPF